MDRSRITGYDVKSANRRLYDAVAGQYEKIDGRRSPALTHWLRRRLTALRRQAPGDALLDIGTGSGLVLRCAQGVFSPRVGVDLSYHILAANRNTLDRAVVADSDRLPFADDSFDLVSCFAVLHHLFDFTALVLEVARVLRPGGVFYSDHDMDSGFSRRFAAFLCLYRRLKNARAAYVKADREITREIYDLTEWQADGVNSAQLVSFFEQAGFSASVTCHWFGLTRFTDRLFGETEYPGTLAPLFSLVAVKQDYSRGNGAP